MKTEAKAGHTAGPWRVQCDPVWAGKHPVHDNRFVTTEHELEVFENEHGEIDACFPKDEGEIICKLTDSEHQAGNARLIAAAPELLEACKAALKLLHADSDMEEDCEQEIKQLETAIEKAEGRQ